MVDFSGQGDTLTVNVVSTNDWSASTDADWLIVIPANNTNNLSTSSNINKTFSAEAYIQIVKLADNTISFYALANPTDTERSATITVSSVGTTDQLITVTQAAGITGINGIDNQIIAIYPNPATTTLYINGLTQISTVSIFDLNGKILFNNRISDNQVDISHLSNGIYSIKIEAKSAIWIDKFVKQ